MFNYVDILGIDENEKTVLAEYRNGSFSLDAIPAAVCYMRKKDGYTMLLKDCMGLVVQVDPSSTVDTVEADWLALRNVNYKSMREELARMMQNEQSNQPSLSL